MHLLLLQVHALECPLQRQSGTTITTTCKFLSFVIVDSDVVVVDIVVGEVIS